jgi:hypothetical protein
MHVSTFLSPVVTEHQLGQWLLPPSDRPLFLVTSDLGVPPEISMGNLLIFLFFTPNSFLDLLSFWLSRFSPQKFVWTVKLYSFKLEGTQTLSISFHPLILIPTGKAKPENRKVELMGFIREVLVDHPNYHYSIRQLYKHGDEIVILGAKAAPT